jgi:hypothetical protein
LLNSYYNVPFPAAFLSEILNYAAEQYSMDVYRYLKGPREDGDAADDSDSDEFFTAMFGDIITAVYPVAFAAVIYGFVLVQACRFFLPTTLVVHFLGIATVEPARVNSLLSSSSAPSLYEVFSAVFLSISAVAVNAVCGIFSRNYIFDFTKSITTSSNNSDGNGGKNLPATSFSRSAAIHRRTVAVRAIAASLSVGLSIFSQCLFGIPGVDAVGAAVYASIWAVAPLLVAVGLGYTGI